MDKSFNPLDNTPNQTHEESLRSHRTTSNLQQNTTEPTLKMIASYPPPSSHVSFDHSFQNNNAIQPHGSNLTTLPSISSDRLSPPMNNSPLPDQHHMESASRSIPTFGSKATNISYDMPSLPPIQESNMCSSIMQQGSRESSFLENNRTTSSPPHHQIIANNTSQPSSYYNHQQQTQQQQTSNSGRMQSSHVGSSNVSMGYRSTNHMFADPSSNNSVNMMVGQQSNSSHKISDQYQTITNSTGNNAIQYYPPSPYDQHKKRVDGLTSHMQEMLEFDLHLSNSDMRQLYSDGYYNPSLLSATTNSSNNNSANSNSGNSNNGSVNSNNAPTPTNSSPAAVDGTTFPLTRVDYIKCTTNGVFTSFGKSNDTQSSSSSGGRASPDNSETQGLTWYENQQVVLHLWVKIKEQSLNRFKSIFDDYTSGNLNPSFITPMKFQILYKNAEFPAKEVLVHEFSLDPIQCYQKYLKNSDLEEKSADIRLIYTRNLDFSLERKTVKVVNKRLKVRFEMIALPFSSEQQRISLLLSPTIVCLTARSFFFDKRRIKTAKGSLVGNATSTPPHTGGGYGGVTSSNSGSSPPPPTGTKLRQVGSSVLSDSAMAKSNSLICEESPSTAFSQQSPNHSQAIYNPYPPTTSSTTFQTARTQVSQLPNTTISHPQQSQGSVPTHQEQVHSPYYPSDSSFKNHLQQAPQHQQYQQHSNAGGSTGNSYYSNNSYSGGVAPHQTNYRPNYSASSLMADNGGNHQHYYQQESRSSSGSPPYPAHPAHVKQSPVSSSLPPLSSIFSNSPMNTPNIGSSPPHMNPQPISIFKSEPPPFSSNPSSQFTQPPPNNSSRNQFLQLSIPIHSLPKDFMDTHESNEILVNDFLEFVNSKYRQPSRNFAKLQ